MKKIGLLLLALVGAVSVLAAVSGCSEGPPKDNTNVKQPPKPAPPGTPQTK